MDGVLVLSEPLHCRAWVELLHMQNIEYPDFFRQEEYVGVSDNAIASEFAKKLELNELPEILLEKKQQFFLNMIRSVKLEAPIGRNQFLEKSRSKYLIAVVSSSSKMEVEAILNKEELNGLFDFIITGDDVINHKPLPDAYLLALEKAGVTPDEAIAIEDSRSGIVAAKKAGIEVINFDGNFESAFTFF